MRYLFFLCTVVYLFACNNATTTPPAGAPEDTMVVVADSTAAYDTAIDVPAADTVLLGFYNGVLPCKDCQGIRHTLLLKRTGLFRLEEFVLGKNTFPDKLQGRWMRSGDSLRLMANQQIMATYFIKGDTLRLGHFDGRPVADSIAHNYWIVRAPAAGDNAVWRKKAAGGVTLYAIGTEPFWNVQVDKEKGISFKPAELQQPLVFPYSQPVSGKDSTVYTASNAGGKLEIVVYNEFCNDGMSDNLYEQRVTVRYKGVGYKGCGVSFK